MTHRHRLSRAVALVGMTLALAGCTRSGTDTVAVYPATDEPPGRISITGRNVFRSVEHTFTRWRFVSVHMESDPNEENELRGEIEVEIDLASVETGNERMNRAARSEAFFDVARYPTARLWIGDVREVRREDGGRPVYEAAMEIEVRGVERPGRLEFEVLSLDPLVVSGEVKLRRSAFGIGPPFRWYNPFSIWDAAPVQFEVQLPQAGE